jgi:hypothetical protein
VSLWTIDGAEDIGRVAALDQSAPCPLLRWTAVVVVDAVAVVVASMVPGSGMMRFRLAVSKFRK